MKIEINSDEAELIKTALVDGGSLENEMLLKKLAQQYDLFDVWHDFPPINLSEVVLESFLFDKA